MDALFRVAPLGEDDEARGFALVNFYDARVTPADWRSFLESTQHPDLCERATVLIQDKRGYAHAVVATWPDYDLVHGKILRARTLACSAAPGRLLHETILAAAEGRARETGCGGVVIEILDEPAEVGATDHHPAERGMGASIRCAGFERIGSAYYRALPRS
jgi:hypothetical protein